MENYSIELPRDIQLDNPIDKTLQAAGISFRPRRNMPHYGIKLNDISKVMRFISVTNFPRNIRKESASRVPLNFSSIPILETAHTDVYLAGTIDKSLEDVQEDMVEGIYKYNPINHNLYMVSQKNECSPATKQFSLPMDKDLPLDLIVISDVQKSNLSDDKEKFVEEEGYFMEGAVSAAATTQLLDLGINATSKMGAKLSYKFNQKNLVQLLAKDYNLNSSSLLIEGKIQKLLHLNEREIPYFVLSMGYNK